MIWCKIYKFNLKYFNDEWIGKIQANELLPTQDILNSRDWFEYIESTGKFRCRLCAKYKEIVNYPKRWWSALANQNGVLENDINKNRRIIQDHRRQKGHKRLIKDLQKLKLGTIMDEIKTLEKQVENPMEKATKLILRAAYYEAKLHIAFRSHPAIGTIHKPC